MLLRDRIIVCLHYKQMCYLFLMLDTSDIYIICCPECQNVLLTDRIPVSISVYGSWVTDRQNAKIAYFKGKGV